ncbi:MAG: zinc ribbon domain-containing protein [Planctomycetota bacterium]|jgi:putative FmdB family regulatory protein
MPMYEYQCPKCSAKVERFRSAANRRDPQECPGCGGAMKFIEFPQDSAKAEGRPTLKDVFRKV